MASKPGSAFGSLLLAASSVAALLASCGGADGQSAEEQRIGSAGSGGSSGGPLGSPWVVDDEILDAARLQGVRRPVLGFREENAGAGGIPDGDAGSGGKRAGEGGHGSGHESHTGGTYGGAGAAGEGGSRPDSGGSGSNDSGEADGGEAGETEEKPPTPPASTTPPPPPPPPPPPQGQVCTSCGGTQSACTQSLTRCRTSPVCSSWLSCVSRCSDGACARSCDETYRDAVLLSVPVYSCLCSSCNGSCSSLQVCGQRCTPGTTPPTPTDAVPATLTGTGLYVRANPNAPWQLAPYVRRFTPEFALFSDNAAKERFIYLPRCAQIDTRNMDHWSFPVGTRLWKQFTRDGVLIETRMLARYGTGAEDWVMTSYVWPPPRAGTPPDPAQAMRQREFGMDNVNGTTADIPSIYACPECHAHLTERALGFSAIQLSHSNGGVTFANLVDWGVLTNAPVRTGYDPPGDAQTRAALGYLHANCGGCHNDTGVAVSLHLRLLIRETTPRTTGAFTTGVNVWTANEWFPMDRIEPGYPSESAIIQRMLRSPIDGDPRAMPPLGRELVDTRGVDIVSRWIQSLPAQ